MSIHWMGYVMTILALFLGLFGYRTITGKVGQPF